MVMTILCPCCQAELPLLPGYQLVGAVYEFAQCENKACPVIQVRIEWRGAP